MEPRQAGSKEKISRRLSLSSDAAIPKMDFRDYGIGAQILVDLGIKKLRLLSRDRRKVVGLGYGLEITDYVLLPKK